MRKSRIAIFCGSTKGKNEIILESVKKLVTKLAHSGFSLVYGGGKRGLMGLCADTFISYGQEVIGIIPSSMMIDGIFNEKCTRLIVTKDMHERKRLMYENSDSFIILPGGIGSMDEFFEIFTWRQLGYHKKNIAIFNPDHFYDGILSYLNHAVDEGFINKEVLSSLIVESDISALISRLEDEPVSLPDKLEGVMEKG